MSSSFQQQVPLNKLPIISSDLLMGTTDFLSVEFEVVIMPTGCMKIFGPLSVTTTKGHKLTIKPLKLSGFILVGLTVVYEMFKPLSRSR
jgi:hypothetical protein